MPDHDVSGLPSIAVRLYRCVQLLPKSVRDDMGKLYNFVLTARTLRGDDPEQFRKLQTSWQASRELLASGIVVGARDMSAREHARADITFLTARYRLHYDWIEALLAADSNELADAVACCSVAVLRLPGRGLGNGVPEAEVVSLAKGIARSILDSNSSTGDRKNSTATLNDTLDNYIPKNLQKAYRALREA